MKIINRVSTSALCSLVSLLITSSHLSAQQVALGNTNVSDWTQLSGDTGWTLDFNGGYAGSSSYAANNTLYVASAEYVYNPVTFGNLGWADGDVFTLSTIWGDTYHGLNLGENYTAVGVGFGEKTDGANAFGIQIKKLVTGENEIRLVSGNTKTPVYIGTSTAPAIEYSLNYVIDTDTTSATWLGKIWNNGTLVWDSSATGGITQGIAGDGSNLGALIALKGESSDKNPVGLIFQRSNFAWAAVPETSSAFYSLLGISFLFYRRNR